MKNDYRQRTTLRKRDPEGTFLSGLYDPALLEQRPKVDIQIFADAYRRYQFDSFSVPLFVGHVRSSSLYILNTSSILLPTGEVQRTQNDLFMRLQERVYESQG